MAVQWQGDENSGYTVTKAQEGQHGWQQGGQWVAWQQTTEQGRNSWQSGIHGRHTERLWARESCQKQRSNAPLLTKECYEWDSTNSCTQKAIDGWKPGSPIVFNESMSGTTKRDHSWRKAKRISDSMIPQIILDATKCEVTFSTTGHRAACSRSKWDVPNGFSTASPSSGYTPVLCNWRMPHQHGAAMDAQNDWNSNWMWPTQLGTTARQYPGACNKKVHKKVDGSSCNNLT